MEKLNKSDLINTKNLPFGVSDEIPNKVGYSVRRQVNVTVDLQFNLIYNFVGGEVFNCITNKLKKWVNGENKYA